MNNTEDEGIETSLDMNWVASLAMKVSDTNFKDRSREPLLVSLSPYHRDKTHLQAMNQVKWKYLKFVLELNPRMVLNDYVDLIKNLETQARDAYSEEVEMSSNSFVEMMLLDGCFLMLTIIGRNYGMKSTWWSRHVVRDIFVLENQLPFFLLETLYESAFPYRDHDQFRRLTVKFIGRIFSSNLELPSDNETFHHIIHLCLSCIDPTINHGNGNDNQSSNTFGFLCNSKLVKTVFVSLPSKLRSSLLSQVNKIRSGRDANPEEDVLFPDIPWIPSATVCNGAGIQFKRKHKAKSFLDITFQNGKLEIPQIRIDDCTISLLKNLIAYEDSSRYSNFHVTSYMVLMDLLINTAADVELLQHHEIIISSSGDSQEIATLFNKLGTYVSNSDEFYFDNVVSAMSKHRHTRYSKWRARWNHNYFGLNRDFCSNPWAVISLFAALTLFVLAVIQSTFAFLSYFLPPK